MSERLKVIVRDTSLARLAAFAPDRKLVIENAPADQKINGHWMAVILISGEKLRMTFKVQFSTESGIHFAKHVHSGKAVITPSQAKDFVREYCNMAAGYLKNSLVAGGIPVGTSLPLLSRGFDNLFFAKSTSRLNFSDYWCLTDGQQKLFCSMDAEIYGELTFPENLSEFTTSGEVEFL